MLRVIQWADSARSLRSVLLAELALLCLTAGCNNLCGRPGSLGGPGDSLILEIHAYPALPTGSESADSHILVAVWANGQIIRRQSDLKYVQGLLTAGQLSQLTGAVNCGMIERRRGKDLLVIDAASEWLYVRCDGEVLATAETTPRTQRESRILPIKDLLLTSELEQVAVLDKLPVEIQDQVSVFQAAWR